MSLSDLSGVVNRVVGVIASSNFSPGDRAALRRMVLGHAPPLAFYRFAIRHLPEGWENDLDDWVALIAGMAIMAPAVHAPNRPWGEALSQQGFSEARLERLLAAEGDVRRVLFLRTIRFLASRNVAFNWLDAARFILTKDDAKFHEICRRIAGDYYTAMLAAEHKETA